MTISGKSSFDFDPSIVRPKMMELWKETFHDSDFYINLVFSTYFRPGNAFCRFDGDKLIAMMLCVPYNFLYGDANGDRHILKGCYLCGLATLPPYRRKGIMADLMNEVESEMINRNFDFLFLIPADGHLRDYYARMGYFNCAYRCGENIEISEETSDLRPIQISEIANEDKYFLFRLASRCSSEELNRVDSGIIHSPEDLLAAILENENTFILAKESFDAEYPNPDDVAGVVFPNAPVGISGCDVEVLKYYCLTSDTIRSTENHVGVRKEVLEGIRCAYQHSNVHLVRCECDVANRSNVDSCGRPYAMAKFIRKGEGYGLSRDSLFDISLLLD